MDFRLAKKFRIPFGKYKGQDLDTIASDDEGLKYLDWLAGERDSHDTVKTCGKGANPVDRALVAYLEDPTISKELEEIYECE